MLLELNNKNYKVDFQSKQLTFLDQRYYTTPEGGFVPSVTTILEAYPKTPDYYAWLKKMGEDADTVRDEAGRRGSKIHAVTERYDAGEEINLLNESGFIDYTITEWAMIGRYVEFMTRYTPEILHTELNIVSPSLGFAGTLDRVMIIGEKTYLVDIKTSNAIYDSYWLQLAAYEKLLTEAQGFNPVDEVAILWLNAKTRTDGKKGAMQGAGWQLITREENAKDWELFQATHKLWQAQNGDTQPKTTTYHLSFKKQ